MATRKTAKQRSTKYGPAAKKSVESALHRAKKGSLKSGAGRHPKVKSRQQAIAIGLSEARKKGAKVPPPPRAKRSTAKTKPTPKPTARGKAAKAKPKSTAAKRQAAGPKSSKRKKAA